MIEKYFVMGVRLKWTFPGDNSTGTKDGSIIANPPLHAGPMVYDGMDGELFDVFAPNVSTLGFTKGMSIPYSWLVYTIGHTSKKMLAAGDVLTGYMSGCLITLWTENGYRYVGHLGTVDSSEAISARVKTAFAAAMPRDTTGFNPAAAWDPGEIGPKQAKFKKGAETKVLALVTTGGEFYSILLFKPWGLQTEWCVGGIKKVPPINRDALYLQMRKLPDR
jgi:hypothetical protein